VLFCWEASASVLLAGCEDAEHCKIKRRGNTILKGCEFNTHKPFRTPAFGFFL